MFSKIILAARNFSPTCLFPLQVFIMGFGNIGIELAKRLRPFGVKILATKRSWDSYLEKSFKSDGV